MYNNLCLIYSRNCNKKKYLCKNEFTNKFLCKNRVYTQVKNLNLI